MLLALGLAALLLQPPGQPPRITSERTGESSFRLRIVAPGLGEVAEAQRLLLPEAVRLCAPDLPTLGRYRWEGEERMPAAGAPREPVSLALEQEVSCGRAPPPMPRAAAPSAPARPPDAADEAEVRAATRAYFAARDGGRYAEAWAMMTPGNQQSSPLGDWSAHVRAFNARAGAVRERRLVRLTWYDNPPGAPEPGLYAAIDFSGDFAGLHFQCGYVIWLRRQGGWRLVREEESVLARADAPGASAEEIARLRQQFGCRD